jgi:hypothetical protein
MCTDFEAGTSNDPRSIVLGIHDEIAINYMETGESYDRSHTKVDILFFKQIAEVLHTDPDPKSMAECMKRSD